MKEHREYAGIKYRKFVKQNNDDHYIDEQFKEIPPKIPWQAIGLAFVLFLVGVTLLVMAILILTGYLHPKYEDRTGPLFIIGLLMVLPGAYHLRIAYYAFRGYPGFSFDDIPECEYYN